MDNTRRIEILRPGTFTAVDGRKFPFTDADMAGAAAAYDPVGEPAPLVVGHPMLDAPAYGWVGSLVVEGGKLVATPEHVNPAFAEAVKAKSYRRVSASWYPPDHPQNPKPGAWYLKHVGFLGAAPPAIRGLEPVHFSEAQITGAVTIDFEPQETDMADAAPDRTAEFAERESTIETKEAALAEREAAIAERERADAETARLARHAANVSFAEGLAAAGKLAPAGKDLIVGLMDTIDTHAAVSFGEANGELAPIDAFKKLFEGAQPIVSFAELAPGESKDVSVVSFAAPSGYTVDGKALEVHGKALAHQAAHPSVSYIDAVKAVS